ncbi:hypothetical protein VNO77_24868 [Canavalia gladiata]|uniref:Cytochrome P450 n=1 Tax=Canavalia gladiata TaxID=3824 RepID=A0AAN9L742_CANGL
MEFLSTLCRDLNPKDWYDHSTTLFLAFLVISAVTYYAWLYFPNPKAQRLPPGPLGLPIVGNLLSLDPLFHSYFARLAQIYGPIFKVRFGSKLVIVLTSPAMAREVLKDQDTVFANRNMVAVARVFSYGGSDIAWASYGPEWRMLRKVCVAKMLSNTTLDSVYYLRRKEVRKTMSYFYSRPGRPVNVGEQLFLTALNVTTSMMWGGTVEGVERDSLGAEFRELVSEITQLFGKPNVSDFFPCLARFDLQGAEKQMRELVTRLDGLFEKVIGQRMKMEGEEGTRKESNDFLQFLLKLKEEDGDSKIPLTITRVKGLLLDMVVGGTETSANTIEFAMAEMMNNPEVMKRVQEELEAVVGKDSMVEESHIHKLPYLQAVMKETLRLHPPLPLLLNHCSSEATTVGGYKIPKGSQVFVNAWAIHRDPSMWEKPFEFDPTRFLDSEWDYSGNNLNYIPFGSGRRSCAGIAMADRTVLYFLAMLVHLFNWTLPQEKKLDISEKGIVLNMKTPLVAIPIPRLSNPTFYE